MKWIVKILFGVVFMIPLSMYAHPGHGQENPLSPAHYTNNPEHVIQITLMIAVAVVLFAWLTNRKNRVIR